MTTKIIYIFIFLLFTVKLSSQNISKERYWNIKVGYSKNDDWGMFSGNIGDFRVETNCQILKFLDVGVYSGYTVTQVKTKINKLYIGTNSSVISYGINSNINFLPLFFTKKYRYNPYLTRATASKLYPMSLPLCYETRYITIFSRSHRSKSCSAL